MHVLHILVEHVSSAAVNLPFSCHFWFASPCVLQPPHHLTSHSFTALPRKHVPQPNPPKVLQALKAMELASGRLWSGPCCPQANLIARHLAWASYINTRPPVSIGISTTPSLSHAHTVLNPNDIMCPCPCYDADNVIPPLNPSAYPFLHADGRWMEPHTAVAWLLGKVSDAEKLWAETPPPQVDYALIMEGESDESFFMTSYAQE